MKTWLKTTQTRPRVLWFLPTHLSCKDRNFSWLSGLSWEKTLLHTLLHSETFEMQMGKQGSLVQVDTKWKHKSFTLSFWAEIPNLSGRSVSRIFRSSSPSWDQHLGPLHRSSKLKKVPCKASWGLAAGLTTSLGSKCISEPQGYISGKRMTILIANSGGKK